jgi:hypothetical protein
MKKIKLYKKSYFDNVVIITGTHCSGKSMLSPIVSSLTNVEHIRKILTIDQVIQLASIKKIDKLTAAYLVKQLLDKNFYEQLIGRNTNLRPEDETSVFLAKNTNKLMKRIFIKRGPHIIEKHKKKTIFAMDTHDAVMFFDIWKIVNKKFKFINIYRNPIDTVASWFKHGMGRLEKILINELTMFVDRNYVIPFYQLHNYNKYKKISEVDKIINMVLHCMKKEYKNYKKYKYYKNLLFLNFEDFSENTYNNIKKINLFLNTTKSKFTDEIVKRENCPRVRDNDSYLENFKKIKFLSSREKFKELLDFEKLYTKRKRNIL